MAFNMLDTPRTELDNTRLDAPDYTTENSIPSPSKEGNSLLKQIRGMRQPSRHTIHETPRQRQPFLDRRNVPAKNEFTPLLKSATRNRQQMHFNDKENVLETPAGLRHSYHSGSKSSPALPGLGSSVIMEEHTGTSADIDPSQDAPALPASSSSVMSTPMAAMQRDGNGVLEHGNMATLREQEQRLEQIDKENFSLKLKIHFLEEALRRNGKEFNEVAIQENTELKVDKVTLQRDLKHYRKQLAQAEKELEDYKRQLFEYADKVKRRHADESILEELDKLRRTVDEKEEQILKLQRQLKETKDDQATSERASREIEELKDNISDLEHDLRDRDRRLDEREAEIERMKERSGGDEDARKEIEELQDRIEDLQADLQDQKQLLSDREDEVKALRKQSAKDEDVAQETQRLKDAFAQLELDMQDRDRQLADRQSAIESLKQSANDAGQAQGDLQGLRETIGKLEAELQANEQHLRNHADQSQKLKVTITDLEADVRDRDRQLDERDEEFEQLQDEYRDANQRLEELTEETERLKEQASREDGAQMEIDHLKQQLATNDGDIKRLQKTTDEMRSLRDRLEEKEEDLKALQDALRRSGTETDAKLRQKDRLLEEKEDELQELENQLHSAGQDRSGLLHGKDDDIQERDDRIKKLKQDISDLKSRLEDAEADIRAHDGVVDGKDEEIDVLRQKMQQLERDTDDELLAAQERIDALEAAEKKMKAAAESARAPSPRQESKLATAQAEVLQLESKLEASVQQVQHMQRSAQEATKRQQEEMQRTKSAMQELEDDVEFAQEQEMKLQNELNTLREQIQRLEKQLGAKQRSESGEELRQEIQALQRDLDSARQALSQREKEVAKATKLLSASEGELIKHKDRIQDLEDEVDVIQQQAEADLRKTQLHAVDQQARTDLARLKREKQQLQDDLDLAQQQAADRSQLAKSSAVDQHARLDLAKATKGKQLLQDELATLTAQHESLQSTNVELEHAMTRLERQLREANSQLPKLQRDFDRKLESQVSAYELDIRNLEQDLADAESRQKDLAKKYDASQATESRMRTRVAQLEQAASAAATTRRPSASPSAAERSDLHQMLKDAKLEAEDLALQLQDRDAQLSRAVSVEAELRKQLQRLREERSALTRRVASDAEEMAQLRAAAERLEQQSRELRAVAPSTADPHDLKALQRRHVKELNGLARQIEYLAARVRREERFRADLQHTKHFFQQSVAMYAQCNKIDLRLVREIGVPVNELLHDEQERARLEGPGRVRLRSKKTPEGAVVMRSRPTLKVLGQMVCAAVRMQRGMREWRSVREAHEELMRKLRSMRKETAGEKATLGKRKSAR